VVLIISERFIASPNCDRELVEAVGLGKRLIPVLAENIPIERLPAPVPDLDLIVASGADLTAVVDEVVEAVETDLEWLDEHTRLLQSALRWAETPEDRSLLLRGNDLRAMLVRVAAAGARAPTVTAAQRSFLTACEENRRRVRNLSWAAALAATAIVGLAAIATVQRAAAVEARTGAEAQRIAADATALYDTQLDLGLRLALTAHAHEPGLPTVSALLRGLTNGPGLGRPRWWRRTGWSTPCSRPVAAPWCWSTARATHRRGRRPARWWNSPVVLGRWRADPKGSSPPPPTP
jgi:hypothetical protein